MKVIGWAAAGVVLVTGCASEEQSPDAPGVREVEVRRVTSPPVLKKEDLPEPSRTIPASREPSIPEPPVETRPRKGTISQVDLQQVFEMQGTGQMFLVDVRPTLHYTLGHIPGAIGMQKKTFEQAFPGRKAEFDAAVAAGKTIVLYCANVDCPDAHNAARILAKQGYSSAVYKGGWEEWKASGL